MCIKGRDPPLVGNLGIYEVFVWFRWFGARVLRIQIWKIIWGGYFFSIFISNRKVGLMSWGQSTRKRAKFGRVRYVIIKYKGLHAGMISHQHTCKIQVTYTCKQTEGAPIARVQVPPRRKFGKIGPPVCEFPGPEGRTIHNYFLHASLPASLRASCPSLRGKLHHSSAMFS